MVLDLDVADHVDATADACSIHKADLPAQHSVGLQRTHPAPA